MGINKAASHPPAHPSSHLLLSIHPIDHPKQLHTPTNLLLLSLATSDFLIGLLMVFQILLVDGCWLFGDIICACYFVLDYTFTSASIGTMVLISIDRYVAICSPLHYSTLITNRKTEICISICWFFSLIFHCIRFKDNLKHLGQFNSCYGECVVVIDYVSGIVDLFFSFIGPVSVIIVLYSRLFVVALSQARAMRTHIRSITLHFSVGVMAKKSELKAARTLGIVVVVFLICVCPYFCVLLSGQSSALSTASAAVIINLIYFNSCLNPLMYACFCPWFGRTIRLIVALQILKPDSSEANIL